MKQIKVTPQKARVKGNLIPNFKDMETPPQYEDFHVSHQVLQEMTYQGVKKDVIRLSPQGEKLYLGITSDVSTIHPGDTATITCTAYYKNGNTNISLSGQTIYVYHNNSQVKTLISDEEGQVVYEFTSTVEGKHNISFKTLYSNGFDPANASKDIVVYTKTELTLLPKSVVIGHDEFVTLSGKLSTNSGVGLPGKPVILMEGAERTLATVITDNDGKYSYKYIESSNRGTPTVLTTTTVPYLVQNAYNEIIGYLKTENGTPISGQKVRLYYGYNAYERCSAITDNNGKYTLRYKPTDTVEREHYIVFCSTVVNTANNQYQTYEPSFLSLGNMRAYKSPELTITNTSLTTTVNEPITINIQVKDPANSKITFNNENVLAQYSTDNSTWIDIQQVKITNNKGSFAFNQSAAGMYYIRLVYNGNSDYSGNTSPSKAVQFITENINLSTTLWNNGTCHIIDTYPISTTVTNSLGNPIVGEVIKYYLNSETQANLMGTATTNSEGVATLTSWAATYPQVPPGTYTVITKHESNLFYEAKTVTNTLKVVKRTRQFSVTSSDSVKVNNNYSLEGEVTYTTHYTNYLLRVNNHDITIETRGLNQQPLLLDDWIQAYLLTSNVTTNVAPTMDSNGHMDVGQKGTVYYKYPITITDDLNITYEFTLQLDTGAYDGRLVLMRLNSNGTLKGEYDYWLPKATYGENPTFRIHIVGNVLTLTEVTSGTLIRERELNITDNNEYYIGFISSTAGKVIIESMSNTLQPLIKYPIKTLDNWYHDTYPGVDETTQLVEEAYVIGTLRQYDKSSHPFKLEEFDSSHTSTFTTEMSLNSNGSLYCGVGTYVRLKNLVSGTQEYFTGDFRVECDIEERDGSHYTIYLNTPSNESGSIQLNKYTNGSNGIQERDTSGTVSKSTGLSAHPFTNTSKPRNKLTIQRLNGVVTISFTDTNGNDYTYTAEQNLGNGRCNFAFYGYADGSLNVHSVTVKSIDSNTSLIEEAYVGANGYVFEGTRKGFVLKRPLDLDKDKYIKVETYQREVWLRVGLVTLGNNNQIIANQFQYVCLNNLGLNNTDLSNYSVYKYEFRVQEDKSIRMLINGTYVKTISFDSGETSYLCIYNSNTNHSAYVKDVIVRQDTIHLKTSNGYFQTDITPAMIGEYVFNFTVDTMDTYYALHRQKTIYSVNKEFPQIVTEELFVDKGDTVSILVEVPEDVYESFALKVYDPDDNEYIHETELYADNGLLYIDTVFDYPKGYYTYSIEYTGDDYYEGIESEKQTLEIRDEIVITCNNSVGNTITAQTKSTLNLSGTIIDSIGEAFTGTLNYSINNISCGSSTVNEGNFSKSINLYSGSILLTPGNHTLKLQCNDGTNSVTKTYTLTVTKKNTTITGNNTGIIKDTNSSPRWQCQVPADFTGKIYVYRTNSQGEYYTGTASTSIISSTNGISASDLHVDQVQGNSNVVNVWWEGKWDGNNTSQVNVLKNNVGLHNIKYALVNDTHYNNAESRATYYLRQPATITTDTNIRQFENENTTINIRSYDTLGNAMNGTITAKVGTTSTTVQITNGTGTYILPSSKRSYSNTNHITDVDFTYKYSESGYWAGCNKTVTARTYNVKTNTYGIFINSPQSDNFNNNTYLKLSSLGITDLYVRANTLTSGYVYLEAINKVINYLTETNHRNEFRIHAVFNCVSTGGTWFIGDDNKVTQERINDLKTHISNLLQLDIDGLCFDYIRRGSSTPDDSYEPDISNLVTELSNYVKEMTPNKTVMISACVVPEYENAKPNYGQNYAVFENVCDYIIPMAYMYDYSSRNETTPVKSAGYLWQQKVVQGIFSRSNNKNKVVPCITTYHGDNNASTLSDKEDLLYQIRGMWNYGLPDNKLQQSIILFREGLLSSDCISAQELYDNGTDSLRIQIEPQFAKKTLSKATEKLQITWKTKWGGFVGELGSATLKINGETQNVEVPVRTGTNLEIPLSLTKFKTGQNDVQIVFNGNNTYDVAGGTWNEVITLQ